MNHYILKICAFCLLLTLSFSQASKNILVIMLDDLNDWPVHNPETLAPNIDRLAAQGVTFRNAFAASPVCRSSRAALWTGLRPSVSGIRDNTDGFFRNKPELADWVTLPQYLQQFGYETIAAGKVFHLAAGGGATPNPDSDPASWDTQWVGSVGTPTPPDEDRWQTGMVQGDVGTGLDGYFADVFDWAPITQNLENTGDWMLSDFIAQKLGEPRTTPFLMVAGIYRPHLPWYAPQPYFDMFDTANLSLPPIFEEDLDDLPPQGLNRIRYGGGIQNQILQTNNWKNAIKAYQANIAYADACVGHILDALENSPHRDSTIVVLMGDHGFHMGEKNHWEKLAMWERASRTTMILHNPALSSQGVSETVVSMQDIFPTLVDMAGLPAKTDVHGRNITQFYLNPNTQYESYALTTFFDAQALRTQRWMYIYYNDSTQQELYDHDSDPNEWFNLAEDPNYAAVKDSLHQMIDFLRAGGDYEIATVPVAKRHLNSTWTEGGKTRYNAAGKSVPSTQKPAPGIYFKKEGLPER